MDGYTGLYIQDLLDPINLVTCFRLDIRTELCEQNNITSLNESINDPTYEEKHLT